MAPPTSILTPSNHFQSEIVFNRCCSASSALLPSASKDASKPVYQKPTSFETLVQDICDILGPSSGIDDVDVESLVDVLKEYDSTVDSHEWEKYALHDPARGYTRNGVDECNKKANLLILVWNPKNGSLIHDHANAHCVMKILKGKLVETRYDWPERVDGDEHPDHYTPLSPCLKVSKTTELSTGDVAYMADTLGLHRMSNPDPNELAVSLHLYTPPYAAKFGCHTFDELTGESTHVKMSSLYSDKGIVLSEQVADTC